MNVQFAHRVSGDGIAMMFHFMQLLREKLPAETWALAVYRKVALSTRPRNIRGLADEVS